MSAQTTEQRIAEALEAAEVTGQVHAIDIDSGAEFGVGADDRVVTASIFKVPVLVELCRRAVEQDEPLTKAITIPGDYRRTDGGTGLSCMLDDVTLSLRDLAYLMMSVSDNRATDILIDQLGIEAVNETSRRFGLKDTVLVSDCAGLFQQISEDLGEDFVDEMLVSPGEDIMRRLKAMRAIDPEVTSRSTPREITSLFGALWRDEVIPPAACAEARRILGLQAWVHRLTTGFPDPRVRVSAKTGTIAFVRNEAGVVEYPDGGRYAVAVFLRTRGPEERNARADTAIGTIARIAVEHVRGTA